METAALNLQLSALKAYYAAAVALLANFVQAIASTIRLKLWSLELFGSDFFACVVDPNNATISNIVDGLTFTLLAWTFYDFLVILCYTFSSVFWLRSHVLVLFDRLRSGGPHTAGAAADVKAASLGERELAKYRHRAAGHFMLAFLLYRIKSLLSVAFSFLSCISMSFRHLIGGEGYLEDALFYAATFVAIFILGPPLVRFIFDFAFWILSTLFCLAFRRRVSNVTVVDGDELDSWDGTFYECADDQLLSFSTEVVKFSKGLESSTPADIIEHSRSYITWCCLEARDGKDHKNKRGRGAPLYKIASRIGGGNILRKKHSKSAGKFRLSDADYQDYLDAVRNGYRGTPIEWAAANGRSVQWVSDEKPNDVQDPFPGAVPPPLYEPKREPGNDPKPRFKKFTPKDRESFKTFDTTNESFQANSPGVSDKLRRAVGVLWIESGGSINPIGNIHRSPKGPYYISAMHERGTLSEVAGPYFVSATGDASPSEMVEVRPLTPWHETATAPNMQKDWCIWTGPPGVELVLESPCNKFVAPPKGETICIVVQHLFQGDNIDFHPHAGKIGISEDGLIHLAQTFNGSSGAMICVRNGDQTVPIGVHCSGSTASGTGGKNYGVFYYPHVQAEVDKLLGTSYPTKAASSAKSKEKVVESFSHSCGPDNEFKCPCSKKCSKTLTGIPDEPGWKYCPFHEHKCVNRKFWKENDGPTPGRSAKGKPAPPRFGATWKIGPVEGTRKDPGTSGH